eukprot:gene12212-8737_t
MHRPCRGGRAPLDRVSSSRDSSPRSPASSEASTARLTVRPRLSATHLFPTRASVAACQRTAQPPASHITRVGPAGGLLAAPPGRCNGRVCPPN